MSSIASLAGGLLNAILPTGLLPKSASANTLASVTSSSSVARIPDSGRLSSFAQVLGSLQQLHQSNPTQYSQVTAQIATNLQSAAQTATSGGNAGSAAQLNQLAADFRNASASGQLPNLQDLARAVGGNHDQHHHFYSLAGSDAGDTGSAANSTATSIIQNTLTNAGIGS